MLNDTSKQESRTESIKNESTRQRWELFHQAIAHAKKSNFMAFEEMEARAADEHRPVPLTSVAS
jgi:hypothetical protein